MELGVKKLIGNKQLYIKIIDNFLSDHTLNEVDEELKNIVWPKHFTRSGSDMYESTELEKLPVLRKLYLQYSSSSWLKFLENELGISGIMPDPHLIGAGYSEIRNGGDLKPHIDFNWNDSIKLYRVASLIIYLTDDHTGGEFKLEDREAIETKRNRALLFEHSETIRHMVLPVTGVRRNVRFFYYASKLKPPEGYHRSLYGFENGIPIDVKE